MKKINFVTIIVCSLNPQLRKLFTKLDKIIKANNIKVILVLQGRIDKRLVKRYKGHIKIIIDNGLGLSRARNIGISKARTNWIMIADDDLKFVSLKGLSKLSNIKKKMIVYGEIKDENGVNYHKFFPKFKNLPLILIDRLCSSQLCFNKKFFDEVSKFDENFGIGAKYGAGEETDLLIKAKKLNYQIKYISNYVVIHPREIVPITKIKKYGFGFGAMLKKNCDNIIFYKYALFIIIVHFIRSFLSKNQRVRFLSILNGFYKFKT